LAEYKPALQLSAYRNFSGIAFFPESEISHCTLSKQVMRASLFTLACMTTGCCRDPTPEPACSASRTLRRVGEVAWQNFL
jgi:hypothetical protein